MGREPMEMPTKFGLIVFHRENRGRIAAEKLATVLRTTGMLVAFMEDRESYTGAVKEENLAYLDFILLPKNTYAVFPNHLSERTKICYYSEKDNLFEILLEKLDQAEADELRKIWSVLEKYDLYSYLDNANITLSAAPENVFKDKLSDFEKAITDLNADVFSTMHVGFAELYLKHFHNKICDWLNFLPDYLLIDEIREMINKKEWHNHLSLTYLLVKELEMSVMDKVHALSYYLAISKIKMNPFIKNEFISNFRRYLNRNRRTYEADRLSEKYFRKLLPGMEVRYFFNFLMLSQYRAAVTKEILDQEVIPKFERYIKMYQTDLEHDLENFTPVELIYFGRISGNIFQSYFRYNHDERYRYAQKKEYPFHDVLKEKIKQYHLKNYEDGLKRTVAWQGFGLYNV